jgi:hypothetical protein
MKLMAILSLVFGSKFAAIHPVKWIILMSKTINILVTDNMPNIKRLLSNQYSMLNCGFQYYLIKNLKFLRKATKILC